MNYYFEEKELEPLIKDGKCIVCEGKACDFLRYAKKRNDVPSKGDIKKLEEMYSNLS